MARLILTLGWLLFYITFSSNSYAFDRQSDSLELVRLNQATNGASWFTKWDFNMPMNTWRGVILNAQGNVTSINLLSNNLQGPVIDLNLPSIVTLVLARNELVDTIPDFQGMPNLSLLDLSENNITGNIPDFTNFNRLTTLRLHINQLTGQIPDFSKMPVLATLQLNNNQLSGNLPDFSRIPGLFNLRLNNNQLTGPMPEFTNLLQLLIMDLSNNQFSGPIPLFRGNANLFVLDVSNNQLTGEIPLFSRNFFLETLNLSDNLLEGIMPTLARLQELIILNVSGNNISGEIPSFNLENLEELDLSGNNFTGDIPPLTLPALQILRMSDNNLEGELPAMTNLTNLTVLEVNGNQLSESDFNTSSFNSLNSLAVQNNRFTFEDLLTMRGSIPSTFQYAPQKMIILPDTLIAIIRDDVGIELNIDNGVQNNTYTWFKDDNFLTAGNQNRLIIPRVNKLDTGFYHAQVRNNLLPALTLLSEKTLLLINCPFIEEIITDSICIGDTLMVQGKPYFNTGQYRDTIKQFEPGTCDSIFIINLVVNPVYDTLVFDTICANDLYLFHGRRLTTSGRYVDTLLSVAGCDSVVRLELKVYPVFTNVQEVTMCSDDTLFIGPISHTETGIYFDTLKTRNGCDSVIITDLVVNQAYSFVTRMSLCLGDSLIWRDSLFKESTYYVESYTTVEGCDSNYILDLIIQSSDIYTRDITICSGDSIVVGSSVYRDPGMYTDSLTTPNGCDSIVQLTLRTVDLFDEEHNFTICSGDTLFFGGKTYTIPGIFLDSLVARGGCDSLVKVRLNVVDIITRVITDTICSGDSIVLGNKVYRTSGIFTDTLPGMNCDTLMIINLSVIPGLQSEVSEFLLDKETGLGSIEVSVTGGKGPYEYLWNNGSTTTRLDSVESGIYILQVSDMLGCTATFSYTLDSTTSVKEPGLSDNNFILFPNPVNRDRGINLQFQEPVKSAFTISVLDTTGRLVKEIQMIGGTDIYSLSLPESSGLYYLKVTFHDGSYLTRSVLRN
jgi:Leucine-rich repeat (LRR) protein